MDKFKTLFTQMMEAEKPEHRSYAFDRLIEEFPNKREEIAEAILSHRDEAIRKKFILLLAEQDDPRGVRMLKQELDVEFKSVSRDFSHWIWLSAYLDYYIKKKNIRVISRFFPLIKVVDGDIGYKIIEIIRKLKLKEGIPFLIRCAELSQPPHKIQEYAICSLGDIGGEESIKPLKEISRNAGAVCKRYAKEAIEKIQKRR